MAPAKLRQLLLILREFGVTEYRAGAVSITMAEHAPRTPLQEAIAAAKEPRVPPALRANPGFQRLPDATRAFLEAQLGEDQ